jgi:translation initiation factor IF-2
MAAIRVYQLAKELNVQSALILEMLDRMGREVKSDLSPIDPDTANLVRVRLAELLEREKRRLIEEQQRAAQAQREEVGPAVPPPGSAPIEPAVAEPGARPAPPQPRAGESSPEPAGPSWDVPAAPAPAASVPAASFPTAPEPHRPRVFEAKRRPDPASLRRTAATGAGVRAGGAATRSLPSLAPRPEPPRADLPAGPPAPPRRIAPPERPPSAEEFARQARRKAKALDLPPVLVQKPKADLPPVPETITLSEAVTVKELSEKLNRKSKDVIAKLISRGVLATINQPLDPEVAVAVAKEFGCREVSVVRYEEMAAQAEPAASEAAGEAAESRRLPRPPVVTVMGHVDHGKTSLLDAIRATNVVDTEHGGITQHIGAYQVEERGRKITFLDTPGHEAFTLMRARGARVTDIVVLVVAADDGVKPQTLEAMDHARAAGVPIVVAINKIDKPEARPDRVKQQLADAGLLVEEYGGQTVCCEISAKKKVGIEELLEMILLVADLQDLRANPDKLASGVILESRVDRARGIVATVLVQEGTLRVGDPFIAGTAFGKVRAMVDHQGRRLEEAGPATPVEVMGFTSEPAPGDSFQAVADEARARQIAQLRQEKIRQAALARSSRRTLESLSREIAEGQAKELPILLKADVQGSLEALQKSLGELPSERVRVNILRASTGGITQADVLLASASNAIIVGFNVRPDRAAADLARQEDVEIRTYSVIYDVVHDVRQAMVGLLEPTYKETILGQAEVRRLFRVPKVGTVAGCFVTEGKVARGAELRVLRDNVVVYRGKLASLKRFKDDVSEVREGFECGMAIANFNDVKEGDIIEFFVTEKVAVETL